MNMKPRSDMKAWLWKSDQGSGTVAGVMLIMVVAVMLSVVAAAGNLLTCLSQARSVADLAVVSAAVALRDGHDDPCGFAQRVAGLNDARLDSCDTDVEDVQLTVTVGTRVPFVTEISQASRAGPVSCE